jgi:Fic family protein
MNNMNFLHGLDNDLKQSLIKHLRDLWTHTSTAIEGNTLSLGETAFVIEEGLTVSGKPLKDHEEVVGHAIAIELIFSYITRNSQFTQEDLFALHKAVQTERVFLEYAAPNAVPALMDNWFDIVNSFLKEKLNVDQALAAYADIHVSFVRIHPFFDANGRIARLVANLPVIKSGLPPIIIPTEKRREYIQLLSKYELAVGEPMVGEPLLPNKELLVNFINFCRDSWKQSLELVEAARNKQLIRNQRR